MFDKWCDNILNQGHLARPSILVAEQNYKTKKQTCKLNLKNVVKVQLVITVVTIPIIIMNLI